MIKKISTDSYFVTVYEFKNKRIIKRRKRKGLHAYPRVLTLGCINNILKKTSLKFPKILGNGIKYIYEEFIEATVDIDEVSNIDIMDNVIGYITELYQIQLNKKYKNITWNNNSEFLKFQIDNLKQVLIGKSPNKLDIYLGKLDSLYKCVDDNRKLCFIHGDIHRKNMIINKKKFYLIDWELATFGDLAYEIAIHFILMGYNDIEKDIFINRLCEKISIDSEKLKNDIFLYSEFEIYRRYILDEIKK